MGGSSGESTRLALSFLESQAQEYLKHGIAGNTQKVYTVAQHLYLDFCSRLNFKSMPASEMMLILFVTELAQTRAHSTIRTYLSRVRHLHILHGFQSPTSDNPRLDLVLKGIQRIKPRQTQPHFPITPAILTRLQVGLEKLDLSAFDRKMLWAACLLAFFAFLRCSEFTIPSLQSYKVSRHLSLGDISIDSHDNPTIMSVRIKSSKTDQFGKGVSLFLGRGQGHLCPLTAILQYLAIRSNKPGPMFVFQNEKPLVKQSFITHIRQALANEGIDTRYYKGHSFRIGAATTAAAAGLNDSLIKTLGRWSSSAYQLYIKTPPTELSAVAAKLASLTDL